ncbi:hypothetical protein MO867_09160 [Microbulbifer sp. OS29]|uniref:Uncharacterized protein n=1 Tax=Microbulbifer okhotskensis TaxID=2926617 RepID=A0A9X2ERQ3_9GAMM|nr:hypothetical protein [Microbulbifer okhotskensis]MCO1334508.1 hypothetical protein [Microbulbifer okhotskensis]
MLHWASLITLEITGIRVERIQDITEEDVKAVGVDGPESASAQLCGVHEKPLPAFRRLWESIYANDSWNLNPWVWVVEFRRIEEQEAAARKHLAVSYAYVKLNGSLAIKAVIFTG